MRAYENLPIIKTLAAFSGNKVRPSIPVDVPFADAGGVISPAFGDFGNRNRIDSAAQAGEHAVKGRWPVSNEARFGNRQAFETALRKRTD
jgi:hypothetical protein